MAVPGILIVLINTAAATAAAAEKNCHIDPRTVYATPFITSKTSKYGLGMEGVSVDSTGTVYATAYGGGSSNGLGTIATPDGTAHQQLFSVDQTGGISYNGLRFLPLSPELSKQFLSRAVATDVIGHQIVHLLQATFERRVRLYTFCRNDSMAQPNDMAVAAKSGRLYISGGKFDRLTTVIGDGDLWMCETPSSFYRASATELGPVPAQRLGLFGITNGIELSPDERTLYLSESFNRNGLVAENKIWKFAVDPATGAVSNRTLFADFREVDGTEWQDVDGIRSDMDGNLFVARNGPEGMVVKLSPEGKLLLTIRAPGLIEATNLDLAGVNGTSLFVVGKCVDEPEKGCVDVWSGNASPGRAWTQLKTQNPEP